MQITISRVAKKNKAQTYPKLIAKLIHKRYSFDDEVALLNNYNIDPVTYGQEYAEYQAYRAEVKQAVKDAFE